MGLRTKIKGFLSGLVQGTDPSGGGPRMSSEAMARQKPLPPGEGANPTPKKGGAKAASAGKPAENEAAKTTAGKGAATLETPAPVQPATGKAAPTVEKPAPTVEKPAPAQPATGKEAPTAAEKKPAVSQAPAETKGEVAPKPAGSGKPAAADGETAAGKGTDVKATDGKAAAAKTTDGGAADAKTTDAKNTDAKSAADEEKARKFRERARRGVLKLLAEKGGQASLSDLHDYSERKYFIAHRSFSRMMEEFVEENHLLWDAQSGLATLTEEGRRFMSTPVV